jgi:hypothetical protein
MSKQVNMKNYLSALAIAAVLFSCSQEEFDEAIPCTEEFAPPLEQFPQTWRLVKMTGSMINSVTTGEAMDWQERIDLKDGNTFRKIRKRDNKTEDASGTFSFSNDPVDNSVVVTLTYSSGKNLIGSCVSITGTETYYLRSKCKMTGTWAMCDGPGLEYERQIQNESNEGE